MLARLPYSARLLGPDVSTRARVVGGVGSVFHGPRSTIHSQAGDETQDADDKRGERDGTRRAHTAHATRGV